ncbi:serine/threonine-protein kinase hal4 [Verticillium dahliae VdLs.17]|uniref:non-specific serine/threonine protein kinase n=1 Tax=Verticillium dahliae (strain VdLs.17 / ATCC MYA-4575 / FGSC 10137) TaxID=498257 RepID=G2X717_VERDV|nr:serine/threonine-protein kinase hal4 [Verticillium dahliae VdLs.17]EGY14785.1 serine/threonine-protein kinase hal4 [Verticillium dahliae VdLs.17]
MNPQNGQTNGTASRNGSVSSSVNGKTSPPPDALLQPVARPTVSMKDKLSRMFSHRETPRSTPSVTPRRASFDDDAARPKKSSPPIPRIQSPTGKAFGYVAHVARKEAGDRRKRPVTRLYWVDTLRDENRDDVAGDRKGGPNASVSLIQKYGKCHEVVGRGAFGIVRISHKKAENGAEKLFAVKEFRRRPEETEKKYSKRLTAEFCISSSLRHPNVIHTLDLLKDAKGDYCEVMEFCAGGDLYTLVLAAGKLEVQEADCFFKQMMRGVEYLHEMGVAHRDLKPENLLLTTRGGLKITDFGNGECFRMAWETDPHMVSGLCGSAPYIAPEEYVDKEFDARAVDVWACGVIYMAMRTGRHLWRVARKDQDEFYDRYLAGRRDEEGYGPIESLHRVSTPVQTVCNCLSLTCPKARCRNVIYSILDPNPTRRITASQVLKSEWGREITLCKAGEEGL